MRSRTVPILRVRTVASSALAAVLAVSLAVLPAHAHAEVRKTDEITGGTVEARSLSAAVCPSIEAEHAILVDADGEVFFTRDASASANIASITKVMTAIVAMEQASLDTPIVVSVNAASVGESTAGLKAGDVLVLEEALKALMIPSGNDAGIAIAETLGKMMADTDDDAVGNAAFVAAMNDKAAELGCENTVFENAHGLDYGTYAGNLHSTAAETCKIVACAMESELFRSIVDTPEADLSVVRDGAKTTVKVTTTDELLGTYDGACGVKTGYTDLAGACFAGACERDGNMVYSIVLDAPSEAQRFTDTMTLFDWYYGHKMAYPLANDDEMITVQFDGAEREVPVVAEVGLSDQVDKSFKATFADPDATVDIFTLDGNVSQSFEFYEISGAVEVGEVVGHATFFQRNQQIAEQDIVACEAVAAPNLLESIQLGWGAIVGFFTGQTDKAESVVLNQTPTVL